MIGKVNEVKNQVVDARNSIKDVDYKMNQIDEKAAFLNLENQRIKSDQGKLMFDYFKKYGVFIKITAVTLIVEY